MSRLVLPGDKYNMNWIEGTHEWGEVICPKPLSVSYTSKKRGSRIIERFVFRNETEKTIVNTPGEIGIFTPFNDNYDTASVCLRERCHTHIFCGGDVSYVMALRMGGEPPHLGLFLTKGSLYGYSVERNPALQSNDRGDIILHPGAFILSPGEEYIIEWVLFSHRGEEDFYKKLMSFDRYISVECDKYAAYTGEDINITITAKSLPKRSECSVSCGKTEFPFKMSGGKIKVKISTAYAGEYKIDVKIGNISTYAMIYVYPFINKLALQRSKFIIEKQQVSKPGDMLNGAFMPYDNETESIVYGDYDSNAARERIGMGLFLLRVLGEVKKETERKQYNPHRTATMVRSDLNELRKSIQRYDIYIRREIFDTETGVVYNDAHRDNEWNRLYNYPWVSIFYLEMYNCFLKRKEYLSFAAKALYSYYDQGGDNFYAIGIPAYELITRLREAGLSDDGDKLEKLFLRHADILLERGTDYPAHEVKYEQSIVAPAAVMLCDAYALTHDKKYLDGAKKQIEILSLFASHVPNFRNYEVAIRHWDGYWFGKNKQYGDTFPHYWSVLSGVAYEKYGILTKDKSYFKKARDSQIGILSMFFPDGSASCAYVMPEYVNYARAHRYDPVANDQDFGFYYILKSKLNNYGE